MTLSTLILLALVGGLAFGTALHDLCPAWVGLIDHYGFDPLGQIFLRLIQFVVVPLVFSSLILAMARIRNAAQMGRYTLQLLGGYLLTSSLAVALGMGTAIVLRSSVQMTELAIAPVLETPQAPDLLAWLISLVPTNPLTALATGNLLQTILSAGLIGLGIQQAGNRAQPFVQFVESIYAISEKILFLVLYASPIGVFALMSSVVANQGLGIIAKLFNYVVGDAIAILWMIAIYIAILLAFKLSPLKLFQSFSPSLSLAFGTASSNAALPVALQDAHTQYGMRDEIASFAIPLGTALKRDGSAIMQGFNAVFIAQLFHIPLTPTLLSAIFLSTFLVSLSTAGVPGAGIIMMTTVLTAAGLPVEGVAIVAGVNRLVDGLSTMLNVLGNIVHAAILDKLERNYLETIAGVTQEVTTQETVAIAMQATAGSSLNQSPVD
ncbi:dicarboxylate/amino acid:cation symporter [Alkalinema sp. FACHB-956]|uniref:dicarboxylate/amino acid:cation symporter n=1 Tax=Alkalinema sp. FACHB-956 TaxID=2692768 RepID=UPI0016876CB5|nr:dicarboxylate/amino acid:cation symporter [Alkalinema sp. FACHB-956]MBD2327697.1 dicarboxylate/amino acid:cation symporter [Alkalinema sp. FACHB-956]